LLKYFNVTHFLFQRLRNLTWSVQWKDTLATVLDLRVGYYHIKLDGYTQGYVMKKVIGYEIKVFSYRLQYSLSSLYVCITSSFGVNFHAGQNPLAFSLSKLIKLKSNLQPLKGAESCCRTLKPAGNTRIFR
jgi:hypothetical protein